MSGPVRVRIAPSPTGDPHVGTAYVALFNLAFARQQGGSFILRIEDTDQTRSTRESERQIFESLRWLGLVWDEGPDVGGPCGPYRQSERTAIYADHCRQLVERGGAYRCFCTAERLDAVRKAQEAAKQQPKYDGHCRDLPRAAAEERMAKGEPSVIRLRVPSEGETAFVDRLRGEIRFQNRVVDDQVLMKSDGFPTYHLANVVDDHLMGITHVMRAEEWIASTPKHILLYEAFGWTPPSFAHLPLLRNSDRSKISKRKNPTSLLWYRSQGYLPETMVNFLALQGFSMPDGAEVFPFESMVKNFSFDRINTAGPVFDLEKLDWLNGVWIRSLSPAEFAERMIRFGSPEKDRAFLTAVAPLVQERLRKLSEFSDLTDFFSKDALDYPVESLLPKKGALTKSDVAAMLGSFLASLGSLAEFAAPAIEAACVADAERLKWKKGDYFMALRVAVTGKAVTPPLCDSMVLLGREKVVARVTEAARRLSAGA